ncbi:hypothetical protein JRD95_01044 [Rickettsia parkeri]|nr:hypothetical protein JRD95_01044 [Rickettsia parkeri]
MLKYKNFDSSSDEELKENYTLPKYLNFLLKNILDINYIYNSEDFKLKLGLVLHNLADRFFKYSTIRNIYKKIKKENISDKDYQKLLHCVFNPNHSIPKISCFSRRYYCSACKESIITRIAKQ